MDKVDCARVAILSSASGGGAGIAASRICKALNVRPDYAVDFVDIGVLGEALPEGVSPQISASNRQKTDTHFTIEYPTPGRGWIQRLLGSYDIVNVHWASYLVSVAEIYELALTGKPILFSMHDFYYSTGGCHYPAGCTGMKLGCFHCPQLDDAKFDELAPSVMAQLKHELFAQANVHLSAPSEFVASRAADALGVPAARTHVLRNAYQPALDVQPRRGGGDTVKIVFIADSLHERRKGVQLAIDALGKAQSLLGSQKPIELHLVGAGDDSLTSLLKAAGLVYVAHGRIADEVRLAEIYQQCDFLLSCSYEDNWPNVLVEAGSYGCMPIVGPGHGCEEFCRVYSLQSVAPNYSAAAFAETIVRVVSAYDPGRALQLANDVRRDHAPALVASSYADVFATMRQRQGAPSYRAVASDGLAARLASMPIVSENYANLQRLLNDGTWSAAKGDARQVRLPNEHDYGFRVVERSGAAGS